MKTSQVGGFGSFFNWGLFAIQRVDLGEHLSLSLAWDVCEEVNGTFWHLRLRNVLKQFLIPIFHISFCSMLMMVFSFGIDLAL